MDTPEQLEFRRRTSHHGNTVSFGTHCYAVVPESKEARELERGEKAHQCDPHLLELWKWIKAKAKRWPE
jgi:hypothetical protein